MIAETPTGWRTEWTSTPVEAFSVCPPLSRYGMLQESSTTSRPRDTSPSASETTLPCSAVMISASSCLRALSSSRNANMMDVRLASEVSRQAGNASAAARMPARVCSADASATFPLVTPVAGLTTSAKRLSSEAVTVCPLIQC